MDALRLDERTWAQRAVLEVPAPRLQRLASSIDDRRARALHRRAGGVPVAVDIERDELARRLGEDGLTLLDVRTPAEYDGTMGHPDDPRQGHIPGARNIPVTDLFGLPPDALQEVVGAREGAEVVVYCHTGNRSAVAAELLRAAGYDARNYVGSWREWSRDPALPAEPRAAP